MELTELLRERSDDIVAEAMAELRRAHLKHYEAESHSTVRERLVTLLDLTLECLRRSQADAMVDYTTQVARERFAGGYDLLELQTAMNVMEEALWKRILCSMEPVEVAHALGLVSAILGMGKDALARAYVSLAASSGAPRLTQTHCAGEPPAAHREATCGSVFPERSCATSTESD